MYRLRYVGGNSSEVIATVVHLGSYSEMVNYLSRFNKYNMCFTHKLPSVNNSILRRLMTITETCPDEKTWVLEDDLGHNVYDGQIKEDVLGHQFDEEMELLRMKRLLPRRYATVPVGFSVPGTGKRARFRGRRAGLSNASILRDNAANPEWVRGARRKVPGLWFSYDRCAASRSWKDDHRYPKQWMRGVVRDCEAVEVWRPARKFVEKDILDSEPVEKDTFNGEHTSWGILSEANA